MIHIVRAGATEALPVMLQHLLRDGDEVGSRQGERTVEVLYPRITLTRPWQREVLSPGRKASITAQIAETMWVLAGRNDVEWLGHYLPRAKEFSDDGQTWRSGYGPRLRGWSAADGKTQIDQLAEVVNLLRADHGTRRAVINLWDPSVDSTPGKDVACTNWLHFLGRDGYLNLHVATRSNDAIWGWSGINAFQWSALLEIVAGMTGMKMGKIHYSISSLHIYEKHWNRARDIVTDCKAPSFFDKLEDSPRFSVEGRTIGVLDGLIDEWFRIEAGIRTGKAGEDSIRAFPEPMMRSWLRVIAWYWTRRVSNLDPLVGTRLHAAVLASHEYQTTRYGSVRKISVAPAIKNESAPTMAELGAAVDVTDHIVVEPQSPSERAKAVARLQSISSMATEAPKGFASGGRIQDPFLTFVKKLHAEKHSVYGDSWKKRGELLSILPNIARKVDRLGVAGAGDTAADTVIDLLVYLVKYRLWLTDRGAQDMSGELYRPFRETELEGVARLFSWVKLGKRRSDLCDLDFVVNQFETLTSLAERDPKQDHLTSRASLVSEMIQHTYPLAEELWLR
jgi:thymidylate synthase